ncbi:MAG: alpha/beta fold hydrolase [Bryobacteraceae bacterium]|nr:alpha/beta fold hydrolase [Bryobacteraceae bacterium]
MRFAAGLLVTCLALGQTPVTFPTSDGGLIHADLYGSGDRAVVLAHGGRFKKESWAKQARELAAAGYRVLAINFRGYGQSRGPGQADPLSAPLHVDVLAAVRYLREAGVQRVSLLGGSMGGTAAADAAALGRPGEIDALIILGAGSGSEPPEKISGRKLLIVAREDTSGAGPRLPRIQAQFDRMTQPKRLLILDGSAHAQYLFDTAHAERVMEEILRFLASR